MLFFEKPSLRTRLTFEAGINSLGGSSFFVDQTQSRLGARESLSDVAHNLERWIDGVVLRTFAHETVTTMAMHASIPVINALSEKEHPCQAMADMLTLQEHFGDLRGRAPRLRWRRQQRGAFADAGGCQPGRVDLVGTPAGYEPDADVTEAARELQRLPAEVEVVNDPIEAVAGADAVYTDVWASMGQEDEAAERARSSRRFR